MNYKSVLGTVGLGLTVLSVCSGIKDIVENRRENAIRQKALDRFNSHNFIHTEESGVLYMDYIKRIEPAVAYLENFRHEGRPDRRASRKVYHSQFAALNNEQLATLFAAGLASEHYSLEYHDMFHDQALVFKSYQTRYVKPEELHTDAADVFGPSFKTEDLIDVEGYISSRLSSHSKTKLVKFIMKHRTAILELLELNTVVNEIEEPAGEAV